jgi:hypothetical protein
LSARPGVVLRICHVSLPSRPGRRWLPRVDRLCLPLGVQPTSTMMPGPGDGAILKTKEIAVNRLTAAPDISCPVLLSAPAMTLAGG